MPRAAMLNPAIVAAAKARAAAVAAFTATPSTRDYPPGWTNQTTQVPASDKSADAQFYAQLGKVADYLAKRIVQTSTDTRDRNGIDHVMPASTQAAISRAIGVYLLNIPYAQVKAKGWKKTLADILAAPLVTWDAQQSFYTTGPAAENLPVFIQQKGKDKWCLHPAYFAFFFWNGDLSFYRFLRYDPVIGFCFTDTFAAVMTSVCLSAFWGPSRAIRIEDWVNYRYCGAGCTQGAQALDNLVSDGLFIADKASQWIYYADNYPSTFTNKLQSAGNGQYSAIGHANLMKDLAIVGAVFAIATAGLSIAASGLSLTNGFSLFTAFESSPFGVDSNALKNIAVFGKVLNLPQLVSSIGLDLSAAPEISAPDVPTVTVGVNPVSVDSIPSLTDFTAPVIDTSTITDTGSIMITPPDVSVVDPSTLVDVAVSPNVQVDIAPADLSTVSAPDLTTIGTDTSGMDSALKAAVTASTDSSGAFNLGNYIGAAAKIYASVTAAHGTGQAPAHMANYPKPGQTIHLPDGSVARTNMDGSTTITSPSGQVQTVLPSGKIVKGGSASANPLSNPLVLGALAVAALLILRK